MPNDGPRMDAADHDDTESFIASLYWRFTA